MYDAVKTLTLVKKLQEHTLHYSEQDDAAKVVQDAIAQATRVGYLQGVRDLKARISAISIDID